MDSLQEQFAARQAEAQSNINKQIADAQGQQQQALNSAQADWQQKQNEAQSNLTNLQNQFQQKQTEFQNNLAAQQKEIQEKLAGLTGGNAAVAETPAVTTPAQTQDDIHKSIDQEFTNRNQAAQNLSDVRQDWANKTNANYNKLAENTYNQRQQDARDLYNQRQADAKNLYEQRQKEAQTTYDERQKNAQNTYDQRNAEAQGTYDQRLAESQGKISDLYVKALEAQKLGYKNALDQGIAAQEEARAGIGQTYQTSANDLAAQYERNRRNMNMQAMANGLNTGTGSQQQLALNQGYMKSYGQLRGEESAQNAGIDRAIANLKVNYENQIAQAIADNDYQKAGALMEDYNSKQAWLDSQRQYNQSWFDTQTNQNQNYIDTQVANNRNYLDSQTLNNQSYLDTENANNRSYLDTEKANNRSRYDNLVLNNQNRYDQTMDANRDWSDNEKRYQDSMALQKAETLASYGNFSGYESLYGKEVADSMKLMWATQNPDIAYGTGAIDAERYRQITGQYPAGYIPDGMGGYFDEKTWNANVGQFIYGDNSSKNSGSKTPAGWGGNTVAAKGGGTGATKVDGSSSGSNHAYDKNWD